VVLGGSKDGLVKAILESERTLLFEDNLLQHSKNSVKNNKKGEIHIFICHSHFNLKNSTWSIIIFHWNFVLPAMAQKKKASTSILQ
jgi:hypothetical protein